MIVLIIVAASSFWQRCGRLDHINFNLPGRVAPSSLKQQRPPLAAKKQRPKGSKPSRLISTQDDDDDDEEDDIIGDDTLEMTRVPVSRRPGMNSQPPSMFDWDPGRAPARAANLD
jgi:hypothetical protein